MGIDRRVVRADYVCADPALGLEGGERSAGSVQRTAWATATIFFYIAINLLMVMGMAPAKGIPLPWMSHGGSSMMTNMICIGLLMMVNRWNVAAPRRGLTI